MARRPRCFGLFALTIPCVGLCVGMAACTPFPEGDGDGPGVAGVAGEAVIAGAAHEKWFIELWEEPLARGGDPILLAAEKDQIRSQLSTSSSPVVERRAFDRLWNGLSINVDRRAAATLAKLPGVKAMYPMVPIVLDGVGSRRPSRAAPWKVSSTAPVTKVPAAPDLATALAMTGADIAQSTLGLTGANVRVGVIDTGIDIHHPDLGGSAAGCFGPGCRVAFGYDFVGDDYDANTSGSLPVPDAIPDDCAGHGTHVAGIIGANGVVKGVAPNVVFGAYRVFGCSGSTDADVMLEAMERASGDGMRVINMSIGSSYEWPDYPTSKAADQLVNDGVVVVCSIGNSGPLGIWAAGAPGVGRLAIGTASFDNTSTALPAFAVSPDDAKIGFNEASGAPSAPMSGVRPIARTGSISTLGDGCVNPPAAGSMVGQIALIRRGSAPSPAPACGFYAKAKAAQDAGAAGVVIYDNTTGLVSANVVGNPPIIIPVVTISQADGLLLNARLDAGPVTMTWTNLVTSLPNATGGRISSFSSYGLASDLSFKPDLGAPGGSIYSTYPLELGGHTSLSGTSMASPHVAGAVALLLEARPDVAATNVRDLLQNTAIPAPLPSDGSVADVVHRQGAGMIHIDAAVQSKVTVSPATLALGESQSGPKNATITVENAGATSVTYDLSHLAGASTTGSYWAPSILASGAASVAFGAPTVTVPAGASATFGVTITADPALADKALYGGYLVLTPEGGGGVLRVPYAGFKGDYQSITMLTPTGQGYPWLAKRPGSSFVKQANGATFTLQGGDLPHVVFHLDHAARRIRLDVYDSVKGKPYGNVVDTDYVPQGVSPSNAMSFSWDGTTVFNKQIYEVPNGTYVLKLAALKALGDAENSADWETWTSPVVTLDHP